ncbi:hypothetical protein AB0H36_12420 [Kribbella sp. NPDC050820]
MSTIDKQPQAVAAGSKRHVIPGCAPDAWLHFPIWAHPETYGAAVDPV